MIEDLRFDSAIVWLLGRIDLCLSFIDIGNLFGIEIILSVLWTSILDRLFKLLLFLLADGSLVLIIDVLFCNKFLLTVMTRHSRYILAEQLVFLDQIRHFTICIHVSLLSCPVDSASSHGSEWLG